VHGWWGTKFKGNEVQCLGLENTKGYRKELNMALCFFLVLKKKPELIFVFGFDGALLNISKAIFSNLLRSIFLK
jgi:hypothetical protein